MNKRGRILLVCSLMVAGLAAVPSAMALRVQGLAPLQPIVAQPAVVEVDKGALAIGLKDGQTIELSPWPDYLPQCFGSQLVSGARDLHPAGPSDRVELREPSELQPWLIAVSGARPGQGVIGEWRLDRVDGRWLLQRGVAQLALNTDGKAAWVRSEGVEWSVYLLEASGDPPFAPGTVQEYEPQADLVIMRSRPANKTRGNERQSGAPTLIGDDRQQAKTHVNSEAYVGSWTTLDVLKRRIGGDGGNRTRVQKHSTDSSTCVVQPIGFNLADADARASSRRAT